MWKIFFIHIIFSSCKKVFSVSCSIAFFLDNGPVPGTKLHQDPQKFTIPGKQKWRGKSIFNSGSIIFHPRLQYLCPLSWYRPHFFCFLLFFFHTAPFYLFLWWTRDLLYTCTHKYGEKVRERHLDILVRGTFLFFRFFFSASLFNT